MSTDTIDDDTIGSLLHFWFEILTPKDWYRPPERVDADIDRRQDVSQGLSVSRR